MVICISGGVGAAKLLKLVIAEAKKVLTFKAVSKELASTMERLLPIIAKIDWSQDVEELKDLKDTIERAGVVVHKCLGVSRWNWFLKSYYTRKVDKINKKMFEFCQIDLQLILLNYQLQSSNNTKLVFKDLCSVSKLDKVYVGLDLPLMKLKENLLSDSVDSLLVSAPPGCGKTTLVTQLCHDQEIKGKFKHIFFNVVSSAPNFRVIVQNLLQHNGYYPFTFDNDSQATIGLRKLLEKLREDGPILLVLDDVWHGAESLLKNFRNDIPDYKILVTSRFDLQDFHYTYHLKPLEDKDAKALLVKFAPRSYNVSEAEYEDLVQKLLKRCKGLPLVIEVVGLSLKGKLHYIWKGQVESWSEWETILDSCQPSVLECLKPSFNDLKPYLKECFMDMGSFLKDQKIRASVLIDLWLGLYGNGTSNSTSFVYMKYLNELASQNLLKLIPLGRNEHEDGFYNEFLVTQHDVLRELAMYQSGLEAPLQRKKLNLVMQLDNNPLETICLNQSTSDLETICLNQRESIFNACFLSISTVMLSDDLFPSTWVEMDLFQFPYVKALVLILSSSNYALPSFIATMKKLKVVIILNQGHDPVKLTNLSCLSSLPKLKRIRLEKVSITFQDILQLQLASLEKLSLFMCCFCEVSYDKKDIDVSKALSSLQEIDIDYCYDLDELPYWISEAVSLETLSITNCDKLSILPEAIGNLSKLKVLRLCSCINLSELPETTIRLGNLQFLDVSHCLGLRKLPLEIGRLQKLRKISMRKCSICELPFSVRNLPNLVVKCDEETAFLWERLKPEMRNLRVQQEETEHN